MSAAFGFILVTQCISFYSSYKKLGVALPNVMYKIHPEKILT